MSAYKTQTATQLLAQLSIPESASFPALAYLDSADHRYLKDIKINVSNVLVSEYFSEKEVALIAIGVAVNTGSRTLTEGILSLAEQKGASAAEIADAVACGSLLAANNVLYRFRHFMGNEKYDNLPARIKMTVMASPVIGKELFEIISLAVSAVNGCEKCVTSHEHSLIQMGTREEKIFDAVRLASVLVSYARILV